MRKHEEEKRKKGVFGGVFKKSKSSIGGSTTSSESYGDPGSSRGTSPIRSDDSLIPSSNINLPLTKPPPQPLPRLKKRPAPKPPSVTKRDVPEACEDHVDHGSEVTTVSHSRHSSDSSGYHESSILSYSPENPQMVDLEKKKGQSAQLKKSRQGAQKSTAVNIGLNKKRKAPPPPPNDGNPPTSEPQNDDRRDSSSCSTPSAIPSSPVSPITYSPASNVPDEPPIASSTPVSSLNSEVHNIACNVDLETDPTDSDLTLETSDTASTHEGPPEPEPRDPVAAPRAPGEEYQECCATFSSDDSFFQDCENGTGDNDPDLSTNGFCVEETFNKTVIERVPVKLLLPDETLLAKRESRLVSQSPHCVTESPSETEGTVGTDHPLENKPLCTTKSGVLNPDNEFSEETAYSTKEEDVDAGYSSFDWEYKLPDPPTPFKDPSKLRKKISIERIVPGESAVAEKSIEGSKTDIVDFIDCADAKYPDSPGDTSEPTVPDTVSEIGEGPSGSFTPPSEVSAISKAEDQASPLVKRDSPPPTSITQVTLHSTVNELNYNKEMAEREIYIHRMDAACDTRELTGSTEGLNCPLDNFSISTYTNRTLKETPYDKKLLKSESFSQPKLKCVNLSKAESFNVTATKPDRVVSAIDTVTRLECTKTLPSNLRNNSLTSKPWIVKRNRSLVNSETTPGAPVFGAPSAITPKPIVGEREPWKTNSLQDLANMVQYSDNDVDIRENRGTFFKSRSQADISTDMSGPSDGEFHSEYVKLERQFQGWKKQLIQNQCVLQNKLSSKPYNLQSLEVIREILPSISRSVQDLNHRPDSDAEVLTASDIQDVPPTSSSYNTSSLDRRDSQKRYSYQGPPAVNFSTWTERPRVSDVPTVRPITIVEQKSYRTEVQPRVVSAMEIPQRARGLCTEAHVAEYDQRASHTAGPPQSPPESVVQVKYVNRSTKEVIKTESFRPMAEEVRAYSRKPSGHTEMTSPVTTGVNSSPAFYHFGEHVDTAPPPTKPTVVSAVKKVANNTVLNKPVTVSEGNNGPLLNGDGARRGRYTSVVTFSSPQVETPPVNAKPFELNPPSQKAVENETSWDTRPHTGVNTTRYLESSAPQYVESFAPRFINSSSGGHNVNNSSGGHNVNNSSGGHNVNTSSVGHHVNTSSVGHHVNTSSVGHHVNTSSGGHHVNTSSVGHHVNTSSGGHHVNSSGPQCVKSANTPIGSNSAPEVVKSSVPPPPASGPVRMTAGGKRIIPPKTQPKMDPREELMIAIRSFGKAQTLKKVPRSCNSR